jgi:ABC-type multidrug transport system permease subunit
MNSVVIALSIMKRYLKEPTVVMFMFFFPLLGGLVALGLSGSPGKIEIGVTNITSDTKSLIQYLEKSQKYLVNNLIEEDIESKVINKEIKLGIVLPEDIDTQLVNGQIQGIRVLNLSDADKAQELKGYIEGYFNTIMAGKEPVMNVEGNKNEWDDLSPRMALGFAIMAMMMFVNAGMSVILEDKTTKTFMRIFCAPVREYDMVLGNLFANMALGVLQILFFLTSSTYILKIAWKVPMWNVFLILAALMVTAIGLAVGLIGLCRNVQMFSVLSMIITMVTTMLGGCFFPTSLLGENIGKISNFIPQKWAMEAFDKIASGSGLMEVRINFLLLFLFGVVFFTFGVKALKPAIEDL